MNQGPQNKRGKSRRGEALMVPLLLLSAWGVMMLPAAAQDPSRPQMQHPDVEVRDASGVLIQRTDRLDEVQTCGRCHDVDLIRAGDTHGQKTGRPFLCVWCHGPREGWPPDSAHLPGAINRPQMSVCARCHGGVFPRKAPVHLPPWKAERAEWKEGTEGPFFLESLGRGEVLSPDLIRGSWLNVSGKGTVEGAAPWDLHLARGLSCVSCHRPAGPESLRMVHSDLNHLRQDPRKVRAIRDRLREPDHQLMRPDCTSCHEPLKVHSFFPSFPRHLDHLACQACHVPRVSGPVLLTWDATLPGDPLARMTFRNVSERDAKRDGPQPLNTAFITPWSPALLPGEEGQDRRIEPVNLWTRYLWVDRSSGRDVPEDVLTGLEDQPEWRSRFLATFDGNGDGLVDREERRLRTRIQYDTIRSFLQEKGWGDPVVAARVHRSPIGHGIRNADFMTRSCDACHGKGARLDQAVILSTWVPWGLEGPPDVRQLGEGALQAEGGGWIWHSGWEKEVDPPGLAGRSSPEDRVGLLLLGLAFLGVLAHGGLRLYLALRLRIRAEQGSSPVEEVMHVPVHFYPLYERIWHWVMALSVLGLLWSGLRIHWLDAHQEGLQTLVWTHLVLGVVLLANAALSFFYHVVTGEITQYTRFTRTFLRETLAQVYHYLAGIFTGESAPVPKTRERKLNPLQQITYLGLLGLLLPFQMASGLILWALGEWPVAEQVLGPLNMWRMAHNTGSWLLLVFLVVHLYLITTGHSPLSHLRSMIQGYEHLPPTDRASSRQMSWGGFARALHQVGRKALKALRRKGGTG